MTKVNNKNDKARNWPWGTQEGEIISLPKLPPEWETITDDQTINCVANLAHLAFATALYSRINSFSYKQRNQIEKLFEEECLNAKGFFAQSAQNMKGDISSERVDFVKRGTAWVDDIDGWLHTNLRGQIDLDNWKDLVRRLHSLIDVHNVLWAISIEHFKSVEESVKAKLLQIQKEYHTETEQKAAPFRRRRITGWIFKKTSHLICVIIIAVIASVIAAIVVDIFADFGWIGRIKDFIYRIVVPK